MKKVNLFIVGEQKSGTTTLHYLLSQHPEVDMSSLKEPGYFCTDLHEDSDRHNGSKTYFPIRKEKEYLRFYEDPAKRYWGEASTLYLFSKVAAQKIYDYNPDAKIIVLLRNPVAYLESLHAQYLKEGGEEIETLEEAMRLESERKAGKSLPNNTRAPSLLFYRDRVRYDENLKRFYDKFPEKNILVLLAEDFKKETESLYEKVEEFLDIDPYTETDFTPQNIGGVPKSDLIKTITTTRFAERIKNLLIRLLPQKTVGKMIDKYHEVSRKPEERKKLDDSSKEKIKADTSTSVVSLENLLKEKGYSYNLKDTWNY